jgi:hypothetical protein
MAKEHMSAAGLSKHLKGIDFPASKEDLIRQAIQNDAGEDVIDSLEMLEDREYRSMADVEKAFGKAA